MGRLLRHTVGFWADMENPYVTYDNNFIESEWWALKESGIKASLQRIQDRSLLPTLWNSAFRTGSSTGIQNVKERSAIVRFKVVGEDAYFLAWTTTPWTLPSNVALCVNPEEDYCKVKAADGYTYYMAEALLDTVLGRLAEEGEQHTKYLKNTKEKTWNTKNMSHYISVQEKRSKTAQESILCYMR